MDPCPFGKARPSGKLVGYLVSFPKSVPFELSPSSFWTTAPEFENILHNLRSLANLVLTA